MNKTDLHPQVRLMILKKNKLELDKQLYQTDLNHRVAERLEQKEQMARFQDDMKKTLSALDLIKGEIAKVQKELDGLQDQET